MQSVLVLDDEALIAFDLADVVEQSGRKLIGPVLFIPDALNAIEVELPDMALLDVNVRDQTSWELARELVSRGCRVVFFSADERPTNLEADLANCAFVRKPASHAILLRAMDAD